MKRKLGILLAIVIIPVSIFSCKKGDAGEQGPPGTANVIYSPWFKPDVYRKDTLFGIYGFRYDKAEPRITQQLIDSGTVLTFGKLLGYNPAVWPAGRISQMPILLNYIQGGVTNLDTWSSYITTGNIRIRFVNDKNQYNVIATAHEFRYIIIPGGEALTGRGSLTYEDICRKYGIPE